MRTICKTILAPGFAIRAALPDYGSAAMVSRTSSLVVAISSGSTFLRGCHQGSLTDGPPMASDLLADRPPQMSFESTDMAAPDALAPGIRRHEP
jgi:hypothetical protein